MKNTTKISLVLIGGLILQSIGGGLAFADVTIDGVTYTDEWIRNNPTEVAKYIDANPAAAAAILQANPAAAAAVANAYNAARGTNYTTDTGMATLNQEATKSGTPANVVVVGNQAYSNDWIKANQAAVVDYISKNPSASANILQNASNDTKQAVLNAYNKATGSNMTLADGTKWINQNAVPGLTREWLAKHGGISKDPVWNDYTGLANDAQVAMWLKENPGLTPAQIVEAMKTYGIGLNQLTRALNANNPGKNIGAQDIMKIANNAGITNEQLSQKGILSPMSWADTRNNIWWAVQAGVMNKGVMCAAFVVDQGTVNPECQVYTKEDMNLALSYQKTGYWGPTGSGDPYIELTKAGMIKNGAYTGPNNWGGGTAKQSSGANIANLGKLNTPATLTGNKDFEAWVNNLPADQGRGDKNFGRGATWQEYNNTSPSVSQHQVTAWMKANPSLTPKEVFANMVKYQIHYYAIQWARQSLGDTIAPYYSFNMGRFGSYDAPEVSSEIVTTRQLYNAGLISINPTGMWRGGFGSLDGIFNGDNVYEGAAAGWLNKWVMYADKYGIPPVTGRTDEQVSFSQKDLDEAKGYRASGYWGPSDSGDMDIEFRKAWYVSGQGLNRRYTYGWDLWRNNAPTGPNIANPAVYKIGASVTGTNSNPYASSFSAANINTLNNWIATKVTAKKSTMTPTAYASFVAKLSAKIDTLKTIITNQSKLNILNYIQHEISK